ncbi:MAG: hypothetical protein ABJO02_14445 [Reichenbachiella sp.]|uniref:hypothetical protein n=1 Tax=Reichenbachiella sp. TaxID=2184521 RepID=UPI003296FB38
MVLKHAVTNHFLLSVILELIIKTFYELDNQETAPFTHNLTKVFEKLSNESKTELTTSYDRARNRKCELFKISNIANVEFHSLDKVLANNETTVKNFKYDAMETNSNSSIDNIFLKETFELLDKKIAEISV